MSVSDLPRAEHGVSLHIVYAPGFCAERAAPLPALPAGLQQLLFNFGAVKNQVSGPVAIVAAGAEVKRYFRLGRRLSFHIVKTVVDFFAFPARLSRPGFLSV